MKLFLTVLVSFVAAYFYFHLNPPPNFETQNNSALDTPHGVAASLNPSPIAASPDPLIRFSPPGQVSEIRGNIIKVLRRGFIVDGEAQAPGDGYIGRFYLTGVPRHEQSAVNETIDADHARRIGTYDHSGQRLRAYEVDTPVKASTKPGAWMWKNQGTNN